MGAATTDHAALAAVPRDAEDLPARTAADLMAVIQGVAVIDDGQAGPLEATIRHLLSELHDRAAEQAQERCIGQMRALAAGVHPSQGVRRPALRLV